MQVYTGSMTKKKADQGADGVLHYLHHQGKMSSSSKLALMFMAANTMEGHPATMMTTPEIARLVGISDERAKAIIRTLRRSGEIVSYPQTAPDGAALANVYWLVDWGRKIGQEAPAEFIVL